MRGIAWACGTVLTAWAIGATAVAAERSPPVKQRDLAVAIVADPQLQVNTGGHTAAVRAVDFSPDSARLFTGGLDKTVQVWNLTAITRDLRVSVLRERTIRWQIGRGQRGSIHALAVAPTDGLVAIGGYGAMGSSGEIVLVDPGNGRLARVLQSHERPISALAFSADGNWLASADSGGKVVLWKRPDWAPAVLYAGDETVYGVDQARQIAAEDPQRPVVFLGSSHVVVPVYVGQHSSGRAQWQLQHIRVDRPADHRTSATVHYGMVSALAADRAGTWLASADGAGQVHLTQTTSGQTTPIPCPANACSLALSRDARTLAVGTVVAGPHAEIQVWDVPTRKIVRQRSLPDHVLACAISPDGARLAYSGGENHQVYVEPLRDTPAQTTELRGKGRRVMKVAFASDEPFYRVAFGNRYAERGFNDYGPLQKVFDAERLRLGDEADVAATRWLDSQWLSGGWKAEYRDRRKPPASWLELSREGAARARVDFSDLQVGEGRPRSYCWLPDAKGAPFAVAVGTDLQNSIYLCRLADEGRCAVLRHFRGHHDYVASLCVSRDLKYLASGSSDGTVRIWSLANYQSESGLFQRWGVELAVQGTAKSRDLALGSVPPRLVVESIHPAGPLFGKGVRQGDLITEIRWIADRQGQQRRSAAEPHEILQALGDMPWWTQVEFHYARNGVAQPAFLRLPAWEPLATLFVGENDQWAYWTPAGYYDASENGHTLFGWLVNRGLDRLPTYYRADQFPKLEQPRVMERLLRSGSLHEAIEQVGDQPAAPERAVLSEQIAATPHVEIVEPRAGTTIVEDRTTVVAEIEVPPGVELTAVRAYANGAFSPQDHTEKQDSLEGTRLTCRWNMALPAEPLNQILILAATRDAIAPAEVVVRRAEPAVPQPSRMYLVTVGVDRYESSPSAPGDAPIARGTEAIELKSTYAYAAQPLDASVFDADAITQTFETSAAPLYRLAASLALRGSDVNPARWRSLLENLRARLEADRVGPDDLVVFFLAGHGWLDKASQQYFFVGHDARGEDLERGKFDDCLSLRDFQLLAEVPCRKLVFLDSCHSGAIQPPRPWGLKAGVRQLQRDVIFTVTATRADQQAAEDPDRKHGIFTCCLLDALQGKADGLSAPDGIVTLREAIAYLDRSLEEISTQNPAVDQHPTASPEALLEYADPLRLTQSPPRSPAAGRDRPSASKPQ